MNAIQANHLSRNYGSTKALDDLSFQVKEGEIYGLIGADGAGKTTLFRILTTLLLPTGGSASVLGHDVVKEYGAIRKKVGYMPGKFSLYPDLSIEENLRFYATIFGTTLEENYNLIQEIYAHIEPFRKRAAGNLSGGMKQKLALCCALIHKPAVLFLDEPTTGIDPISRKELWSMLRNLAAEGITIFASTPYMDEALNCTRIAFIREGKILKEETPQGIINGFRGDLYGIKCADPKQALPDLKQLFPKQEIWSFGDLIHVTVPEGMYRSDFETEARKMLERKGNRNVSVQKIQPGLEDCFMQL